MTLALLAVLGLLEPLQAPGLELLPVLLYQHAQESALWCPCWHGHARLTVSWSTHGLFCEDQPRCDAYTSQKGLWRSLYRSIPHSRCGTRWCRCSVKQLWLCHRRVARYRQPG